MRTVILRRELRAGLRVRLFVEIEKVNTKNIDDAIAEIEAIAEDARRALDPDHDTAPGAPRGNPDDDDEDEEDDSDLDEEDP